MIQGLIRPGVGYYTPNQAAGHAGGPAGMYAAVTNRQTTMSARLGRPVTRAEAHTSLGRDAGNRRVATQGLPSERRGGRINTTMDEMRALARAAHTLSMVVSCALTDVVDCR